jgi:deazaflavin-dependent oxidoreductase (nitroreductase family)
MTTTTRYIEPTRSDVVFGRLLGWLVRRGVSVFGARLLAVRGRRSGEVRTTIVNVLAVDGREYLVAPRGETQWVRNVRAAGAVELRVGRRVTPVVATELADAEKGPVLRAYLKRWGWEVGRFFEGVDRHAGDAEMAAMAPSFPVFALSAA